MKREENPEGSGGGGGLGEAASEERKEQIDTRSCLQNLHKVVVK